MVSEATECLDSTPDFFPPQRRTRTRTRTRACSLSLRLALAISHALGVHRTLLTLSTFIITFDRFSPT